MVVEPKAYWNKFPGYSGTATNAGQNSYTFLYYHWVRQYATDPSSTGWRASFRQGYFKKLYGVPIHFCSTRLNDPNGLNNPSWHWKTGDKYVRPTVFADGHAAVLQNQFYAGPFQHIMSANGSGPHEYWNRDYAVAQAGDYALGEY